MPAAVAVPAIASVATAGLGYLSSRQSPQQKALLAQQTTTATQQGDLAKRLQEIAGEQSTLVGPGYKQALDYYSSMAGGGGRAKQMQSVMPDVNRLNEQYRGAATRINSSLRGPARDQALADLVRQHAMQVAELTGAPRAEANKTLLAEGNAGMNRAGQTLANAGAAFGNAGMQAGSAFNAVTGQKNAQNEMLHSMGQDFAKLWAPYLKNMGGKTTSPMARQAAKSVGGINFAQGWNW